MGLGALAIIRLEGALAHEFFSVLSTDDGLRMSSVGRERGRLLRAAICMPVAIVNPRSGTEAWASEKDR